MTVQMCDPRIIRDAFVEFAPRRAAPTDEKVQEVRQRVLEWYQENRRYGKISKKELGWDASVFVLQGGGVAIAFTSKKQGDTILSDGPVETVYWGVRLETGTSIVVVTEKKEKNNIPREVSVMRTLKNVKGMDRCYGWHYGKAKNMLFIPYYANGNLHSGSLSSEIRIQPKLDQTVAAICHAIANMHKQGIVHGDIKQENIFLTDAGQIRIVDFRLSHKVNEKGVRLGGTASMLAPEQWRDLSNDCETDAWSLGCTLYEILTKQRLCWEDQEVRNKATQEDINEAIEKHSPAQYHPLLKGLLTISREQRLSPAMACELLPRQKEIPPQLLNNIDRDAECTWVGCCIAIACGCLSVIFFTTIAPSSPSQ